MSATDIASLLHARDGQRERCPWCRRELADETDDRLCIDAAEADGRSVGGEGPWLCWSPFGGLGCDDDSAESQLLRAEAAERLAADRLDLLADCLEQIGLRDERGLWDGALSTAEELIEHLVEAGRLARVPGDGPARWEWGGDGWSKGPDTHVQNEVYDNTSIWHMGDLLRMANGQSSKERTEAKP